MDAAPYAPSARWNAGQRFDERKEYAVRVDVEHCDTIKMAFYYEKAGMSYVKSGPKPASTSLRIHHQGGDDNCKGLYLPNIFQ